MGLGMLACPFILLSGPSAQAVAAEAAVGLGTAGSFAVLGGSTVTNTGPTVLTGDLGVSPGTAITGFPPGTVTGVTHAADAVAMQAQADATTAYNDAAGRAAGATVVGDLGGRTLTSGVYSSATSLGLTGTLTLDGAGATDAVFILRAGSTLTTAAASRVVLTNGAQSCNVFWQVGSSATLGTSSVFRGNILALTSISIGNNVTVDGRTLARNGAVTMDSDRVAAPTCAAVVPPGGATPGGATPGGATPGGATPGGATPPEGDTPGGGTGGGIDETGPGVKPPVGGGAGAGGGIDEIAGLRGERAVLTAIPREITTLISTYGTTRCVPRRFRVAIMGRFISRVTLFLDGKIILNRRSGPFRALLAPRAGGHRLTARVTFSNGTPVRLLRLRYRSCAAVERYVRPPSVSLPPRGLMPPGFTG